MTDLLCPTLIGRASEFGALRGALRDALNGRGGLAFVTGEPGIGKSRLARDLAGLARQDGARVVTGRAVPAGAGTAYRPLSEAIAQALRDREVPADPSLAPWLPALSAILPALADARPAEVSPATLGEAAVLLLRRLASPAGLVLILEDLHWADPDTLAIVEYLADNLSGAPVLAVATCRSEPGCAALEMIGRLRSRRCALHLGLSRLDDDQVAQMVRACLPGATEQVVARLQRTADGIPFLVEEVLASPGVPASFADTVRARLASCTSEERLVLDAAAVLGRNFDWRVLPEITGLGAEQVAGALERGARTLLLAADAGAFRFRHALTRESLVQEMLPPRRAQLAARALAAIGRDGSGMPPGWLDAAADLAAQSGDEERAVSLLADSAQHSLRRGALATAAGTLERAAELLSTRPARAATSAGPAQGAGALRAGALGTRTPRAGALRVDALLVEAYALAGRVDEAVAVGDRLIARVAGDASPGPASARPAEVQLRLAHAAVAATRWRLAAERLDAARALLGPGAPAGLVAQAAVLQAEVALAGNDNARARTLAEDVLAGPEAGPEMRCHAHELIGRVERIADLEAARSAFERALATADAADLPVWRLRALHELGTIELFDRVGVERLEEAREAAGRLGVLSTTAVLDLQLAIAYTWRFDLDAGAARARSAIRLAGRLGLREVGTKARYALAENYAGRLDREAMERFLEMPGPVTPGERYLEAFAWGCRGMAELLCGDWAGARELLRKADALLADLPHAEPAQFRAWWPMLLAMTGDVAAAGAIEQARRQGVGIARANRGLLGFAGAVLAGRAGDARSAAGLAAAADADMACVPIWQHLARVCAAGPALADGWGQPERWLTAAREHFSRRGLDALALRCAELLGRPRPEPWAGLGVTPREADVLRLVVRGLRNKDIASRLYVSPRTVEKHVESLLRKAGVRSRAQLAAQFADAQDASPRSEEARGGLRSPRRPA